MLNGLAEMGTVDNPTPLTTKLKALFDERSRLRTYRYDLALRSDLPEQQRVEKTVFIKAPRSIPYGEVARVIDGLKATGADPIGLQLDDLK